jgi:MoaA/NifB/PqqE/SkfB family radical SAM enzyme
MFKDYIGWHIELTRRCPLACPACRRTYESNAVVDPKQDIDTNALLEFFPKNKLIDTKYICLQGNLGDPIYHPNFHNISEHFFSAQDLNVITNGTHNKDFWNRVLETWPENSRVTLSIDGLQHTNHIYRVNSNWNKIQDLFDLIAQRKHKCKIEWKYIVFEHNYHQVEEAQLLADKLGIDIFRIQKSRKLDENLTIKEYNNTEWFNKLEIEYENKLSPFCQTGDLHYITAFGDYYPCCWWADNNTQANFWQPVNIKNNNIQQCKDQFITFTNQLKNYDTCPNVCKKYCRKVKSNKLDMMVPNTQLNRTREKYD